MRDSLHVCSFENPGEFPERWNTRKAQPCRLSRKCVGSEKSAPKIATGRRSCKDNMLFNDGVCNRFFGSVSCPENPSRFCRRFISRMKRLPFFRSSPTRPYKTRGAPSSASRNSGGRQPARLECASPDSGLSPAVRTEPQQSEAGICFGLYIAIFDRQFYVVESLVKDIHTVLIENPFQPREDTQSNSPLPADTVPAPPGVPEPAARSGYPY